MSAVSTRQQVLAALHVAVVADPASVTLAVVRASDVVVAAETVTAALLTVAVVDCAHRDRVTAIEFLGYTIP